MCRCYLDGNVSPRSWGFDQLFHGKPVQLHESRRSQAEAWTSTSALINQFDHPVELTQTVPCLYRRAFFCG